MSYEDVDTRLIRPRPRLYGVAGGEAIEEVWKERQAGRHGQSRATSHRAATMSNRIAVRQSRTTEATVQRFTCACCGRMGRARRSYWQRFELAYEPDMNCISVLQRIAENPVDGGGQAGFARGLGVQLPGGSLRRMHDAGQRAGSPGMHGPGGPVAARSAGRNRTAADDEVSRLSAI